MSAKFFLLLLASSLARAQDEREQSCDLSLKYLKNDDSVNMTDICKEKACIIKCCPEKQILLQNSSEIKCVNSDHLQRQFHVGNLKDYSSMEIYNKDISREVIKTKRTIEDFIQLQFIHYDQFIETCSGNLLEIIDSAKLTRKLYVLEDGGLQFRRFNYINQWDIAYSPGEFCYDHYLEVKNGHAVALRMAFFGYNSDPGEEGDIEKPNNDRAMFSTYGMLVSCVFMLLVFVVYALLKDRRNLAGLMVMAYVATFTAYFLTKVIHISGNEFEVLNINRCIVLSLLQYYTMLSSFSWMNIMSFDIWWTLRGVRKQLKINRRGILVKFCWYCAYAWGLPLAPIAFVSIVDNLDLTHMPYIIKPHFFHGENCFFGPEVILLYATLPVGLMVCANLIFFAMTAYNIWLVRKAVNKSKKDNSQPRFVVYIKLSLLMGTSWILDVVSDVVSSQSKYWYIVDMYNTLLGLFIFIIFVCKRKTILDLCSLFSIDNRWVRRLRARGGHSGAGASSHTRSTLTSHAGSVCDAVDGRPAHAHPR